MTEKRAVQPDGDALKGAIESQSPNDRPETGGLRDKLADQLPHRNTYEWLEGEDSDFPEPGLNPEHSGQHN
ncbi:MAG TPA: hypothetical protein VMD58_04920 [Acidobacteriaceae bacterium]|nr:hypothetical protein [Acidobacteriaceae bacterium]